jgi:hypothetical protein
MPGSWPPPARSHWHRDGHAGGPGPGARAAGHGDPMMINDDPSLATMALALAAAALAVRGRLGLCCVCSLVRVSRGRHPAELKLAINSCRRR